MMDTARHKVSYFFCPGQFVLFVQSYVSFPERGISLGDTFRRDLLHKQDEDTDPNDAENVEDCEGEADHPSQE